VGASVEGELQIVMDAIVSYPIQFLFTLFLISFSFKRIAGGHSPDVVTSGDIVTHKHFMEMRRLARDDTPFSLGFSTKRHYPGMVTR
jgi:hypothetical protein